MKINNVYIQGRFSSAQDKKEKGRKKHRKAYLFNNSVIIRTSSFSLPVTQNIRETLSTPNLKEAILLVISRRLRTEVQNLSLRITNIQHSFNLAGGPKQVLTSFLPALNSVFPIRNVFITQEQNSPFSINLEDLMDNPRAISFMCIRFQIPSAKTHLKVQVSQRQPHICSGTLIVSIFNSETGHLLDYLKKEWIST